MFALSPGWSLAAAFAIGLSWYGLGGLVGAKFRPQKQDSIDEVVWSIGIGILCSSIVLCILGLFGLLHELLIRLLTVFTSALGVYRTVKACLGSKEGYTGTSTRPYQQKIGDQLAKILGICVVAVCVATLVCSLAPPTAGDALCYHLEEPKEFLLAGRLVFNPFSETNTYPMLMELQYLWALALYGPVTAQLLSWLVGLWGLGVTAWFATQYLPPRFALVAAALTLLTPAVNVQMTAPLNDLAVMAWVTLLVGTILNLEQAEQYAWVRAGIALAGAIGTKMSSLPAVVAVCVALGVKAVGTSTWVCWLGDRSNRGILPHLVKATLLATAVSGIWYARAWVYRGDPFYPYGAIVGLGETGQLAATGNELDNAVLKKTASRGRNLSGLNLWTVTMNPAEFGGWAHQLGPLWLALVPVALIHLSSKLIPILVFGTIEWLMWAVLKPNIRFLLPIVPVLSVLVGWLCWKTAAGYRLLRHIVVGTVLLVAVFQTAVAVRRAAPYWEVAFGLEKPEVFLEQREPSWPAASAIAGMIGSRARLLSQDYRLFYFPCAVVREAPFRRRTHYDKLVLKHNKQVADVLLEWGFTHILLVENKAPDGVKFDSTLRTLYERAIAAGEKKRFRTLTTYRFTTREGACLVYRLIELR